MLGTPASSSPLATVLVAAAGEQARGLWEFLTDESLLSENEPSDRHHYFRYGRFHVARRYEGNVTLVLAGRTPGRVARRDQGPPAQRRATASTPTCVGGSRRSTAPIPSCRRPRRVDPAGAHLPHPTAGPAPWDWARPSVRAGGAAGCRAPAGAAYLPLEMYDPVTSRFECLGK